jgi:hypothetical protein
MIIHNQKKLAEEKQNQTNAAYEIKYLKNRRDMIYLLT